MSQRVDFDKPSGSQTSAVELADRATFDSTLVLQQAIADMPCVKSLMAALYARDAGLMEHCSNVADSAFRLALAAGLPLAECQTIWTSGLLHDVGKIILPDSILLGHAPLTAAERRAMQEHVEVGYQLLKCISKLRQPAEVARYHHERWDGTGYPRGLKRLDIPIGSRILAIADAFDAMTSGRSYKARITMLAASQVLLSEAGAHFDPDLVRTFISDVLIQFGATEQAS